MTDYYNIVSLEFGQARVVAADGYTVQDGWVMFYVDEQNDMTVKLAIPGHGYYFEEITVDRFNELLVEYENESIEEQDDDDDEFE